MANVDKNNLLIHRKSATMDDQQSWKQNLLDIERWANRIVTDKSGLKIYDEQGHFVGEIYAGHFGATVYFDIDSDEDGDFLTAWEASNVEQFWRVEDGDLGGYINLQPDRTIIQAYDFDNSDEATLYVDISGAGGPVIALETNNAAGSSGWIDVEPNYFGAFIDVNEGGDADGTAYMEMFEMVSALAIEWLVNSDVHDGVAWLRLETTLSGGGDTYGRFIVGNTTPIQLLELASGDPDAAPVNSGFLFAKDNGAGKTGIYARFPTGAVQQIALEP